MDGNGRWALSRGCSRAVGHRAGVKSARAIVEAAAGCGISILTLFAFSSDNWRRPPEEVEALMWLLRAYLRTDAARLAKKNIRVVVIGRSDRIPSRLRRDIRRIEDVTKNGNRLQLRLAIDYSSRDAIIAAARKCAELRAFNRVAFEHALVDPRCRAHSGGCEDVRPVDLLIRTGGERRLSDFMLWESAYAELLFSDRMWPDFAVEDLRQALAEFRTRERRFGGLVQAIRPEIGPEVTNRATQH